MNHIILRSLQMSAVVLCALIWFADASEKKDYTDEEKQVINDGKCGKACEDNKKLQVGVNPYFKTTNSDCSDTISVKRDCGARLYIAESPAGTHHCCCCAKDIDPNANVPVFK